MPSYSTYIEYSDFNPDTVFCSLYSADCLEAWAHHRAVEPSNGVKITLSQFKRLFAKLSARNSSADVRKAISIEFCRAHSGLLSTTTCFSCMCRQPEHMLICGHAICDVCVVIYGNVSLKTEYHTDLTSCPLCGQPFDMTVRRLPPTKGPMVLSLDGGGVRGLMQLGLLRALEKRLGGHTSLPQIFDYWVGTSVGKHVLNSSHLFPEGFSNRMSFKDRFVPLTWFSMGSRWIRVFKSFQTWPERSSTR